jgi:hypothetical protein
MAGMLLRMPGAGLGVGQPGVAGIGVGPRLPGLGGMGAIHADMPARMGAPRVGGGLRLGVPKLRVKPQLARQALLSGMKGPGPQGL